MNNNNVTLSPVLAKDFELVGWVGGERQNFGKFGVVNLNTLTKAQANSLVRRGFTKLAKKSESVSKVGVSASKGK